MKRILLSVAVVATSLMMLTGCDKLSSGAPELTLPVTGDWLITHFNDNGNIITNDYVDYVFDFKQKNAITATSKEQTSNGFWAVSAKDANQECSIGFNTGDSKLSRLNDDWKVIKVTDKEVLLTDDGEEIHFTRQ